MRNVACWVTSRTLGAEDIEAEATEASGTKNLKGGARRPFFRVFTFGANEPSTGWIYALFDPDSGSKRTTNM